MLDKWLVWGTGSLALKFVSAIDPSKVQHFVDSEKTGVFSGKSIVRPADIAQLNFSKLIICSSFLDEIVPSLERLDIDLGKVFVFNVPFHDPIPLDDFFELSSGRHYHLPWLRQIDQVNTCLSTDMVFPTVYPEIAKSIAYVFIATVEGDFAEFGTAKGYSASLMAHTIDYYSCHKAEYNENSEKVVRKLHLFDSFEGFPKTHASPDVDSPHVSSGAWSEGGAKGLSDSELKDVCSKFLSENRLSTYAGWFKDTLRSISANTRFALVHLDCDLYESTYDVLCHLLENQHLSEGAVLLFDDWFCNRASELFGQQKAWSEVLEKFDVKYTNLGMYGCVSNKFIIHQYTKRA